MSWADGPLCAIGIETTGGDVETTRIVALALLFLGDQTPRPNVIHVLAETEPDKVLQEIANRLPGSWASGLPLIGFDIHRTLTVLDREMRRYLGRGFAVTGPVVDPHVIDLALDRRDGERSLAQTCERYSVRHGSLDDPEQQALAAARLAWKMARGYRKQVGARTPDELFAQQLDWERQRTGDSRPRTWPLTPNGRADPAWDQRVLDVIRHKIRTDWEARLREDGAQSFRTELHIVNDTRVPHPHFTSVRCLPEAIGHDDYVPIALMGRLAQAMAADRVVIAWEPHSVQLATRRPGDPIPERESGRDALMILDVVLGEPTRLSRHPYLPPERPPGHRPFSWGEPEVLPDPTEHLDPVVLDMIAMWREPGQGVKEDVLWRIEFKMAGYDIESVLRPSGR